MEQTLLTIVLAPLAAAVLAGLFGRWIGRAGAHTVTIPALCRSWANTDEIVGSFRYEF